MIATDLDRLWARTQDPAQHVRWDGRFSRIEPIPTPEGEPNAFHYGVRIAPGIEIGGRGTHRGDRLGTAGATSALSFESDHPLSLLRRGAGYWRYDVTERGVEFSTGYDYDVRWGRFGRAADRVWRPSMARLTAWSFDRLRLWIEAGLPPELTLVTTVASISALLAAAVLAARGEATALLAALTWLCLWPITPRARRCERSPRLSPRRPAAKVAGR